jgi:rubrerythrin
MVELSPEIKKHLVGKAKEELNDIISYNLIYEQALAAGNRKLARMINRIAENEYEHAEYLYAYLKDRDALTDAEHSELRELWKVVDRIFDDE